MTVHFIGRLIACSSPGRGLVAAVSRTVADGQESRACQETDQGFHQYDGPRRSETVNFYDAAMRQPDAAGSAEASVILTPGEVASAPLDIVDAAAIPRSACKPVPVRGLRVYPPGERAPLFIPLPTSAKGYGECSVVTQQPTLIVGYVQSGVQPGGGDLG